MPTSDVHHEGDMAVQVGPLNTGSQYSLSRNISKDATTIRASREEKHAAGSDPVQSSVLASSETSDYPGPLALSLLAIGICLSVFLVSLDRTIIAQVSRRIGSIELGSMLTASIVRLSLESPTTSTPMTTWAGMAAHISSPPVRFNQPMEGYSKTSASNGPS